MMSIRASRQFLIPLFLATALSLSACGNKDGKAAATQVAAKVGSEEISVHQINQVLARSNANGASAQEVQAASRDVLEKLIDQQLAVSQAIENKLDRTPETVAAIEAAKRDILARAYIQKIASGVSKPGPEEVKKYFTDHPELFSSRRIFTIQEILLAAAPGLADQLRSMADAGKSTTEVTGWLKTNGIKYGTGNATRTAEQIPFELLAKIHALRDGQNLVFDNPQGITYLHLVSSQSAPVDQAAALPRIEQFLNNQRATEAISADIKRLRSSSTISYMGEFAKAETASTSAPPAAPTQNMPAAPADQARSAIEKGVAGLK